MGGVYEPVPAAAAVDRVRAARGRTEVVRLEGLHALKHALRFGADIEVVITPDRHALVDLVRMLAPDLVATVAAMAVEVTAGDWAELAPRGLPSPALALGRRPETVEADVLAAPGRVLVLERPRHLGNLGAAIRVAAAAGAGGVLVVDGPDPWHPTAVRAAAGLQYALPCAATTSLSATRRPVVALDPEGAPLAGAPFPADALLLVGTERAGLSPELRARADLRVAIAMRPGVSSLNLATAVAVALYHGPPGPR
ncbi:MAG: TrmH family RNA methyltransferase [Nitriliruptoraceae bacterium]